MANHLSGERPKSIQRFELAYFASIVVWLISYYVGWDQQLAYFAADPTIGPSPQLFDLVTKLTIVMIAISVAVSLLLIYLVARRASEVAKWIVTGLFGVSVISFILSILGFQAAGPVMMTLSIVTFALSAYATWMLFRPDAKIWFSSQGA